MSSPVRSLARLAVDLVAAVPGLALIAAAAFWSLMPWTRRRPPAPPRILWGSQPIKALAFMAECARRAGSEGTVAVRELYAIYGREHFDHVVYASGGNLVVERLLDSLKAYLFFARALPRHDVFASYFDGGVLRRTLLEPLELPLVKLLGKKAIAIPYGSDAWALDHTANLLWRTGVLADAPLLGAEARRIERRVRRGCRHADCVLGCLVHIAALPRYDVLPLTCYPIDTHAFEPVLPRTEGTVRIAHSANHRGFKGTEYLIEAVEQLRAEGHDVELDVIERVPNEEVLRRVAQADIYVDQLVAGYAFAALEGMALGKIVISPVGAEEARVFRRHSYLGECPVVSAECETIKDVLEDLISRRETWPEIGRASRAFCERRHSFEANTEMWRAILARIWHGEDVDLINLYHPVLERRRSGRPEAAVR